MVCWNDNARRVFEAGNFPTGYMQGQPDFGQNLQALKKIAEKISWLAPELVHRSPGYADIPRPWIQIGKMAANGHIMRNRVEFHYDVIGGQLQHFIFIPLTTINGDLAASVGGVPHLDHVHEFRPRVNGLKQCFEFNTDSGEFSPGELTKILDLFNNYGRHSETATQGWRFPSILYPNFTAAPA